MSTVKTPGRGESTVVDSQQPRPGHDLCRHELLPASCAQFGRTNLRTSHLATCPQSAQWRRRRKTVRP